jgi:hypothetical protein
MPPLEKGVPVSTNSAQEESSQGANNISIFGSDEDRCIGGED